MRLLQIICTIGATVLAGCDPIGYGYVNQLHQSVAVIHHVHGRDERLTLAAGERRLPALGDWPGSREEFLDLNGREIAAITGAEIKRLEHQDTPAVLVLSPVGIRMASREYWDAWQQEVRAAVSSAAIPAGIPVSGKPGFVISPYARDKGYVDIRGFAHGTKVHCPYTHRIFIVP